MSRSKIENRESRENLWSTQVLNIVNQVWDLLYQNHMGPISAFNTEIHTCMRSGLKSSGLG